MRDAALWQKIRLAPVEVVGSEPLEKMVQKQCGLSAHNSELALAEYRKFLYLRAVTREALAPSLIVDFIWKTHARSVWRRSGEVPLTVEWPPKYCAMLRLFASHAAYARTLECYREEFGSPSALKVWPSVRFLRQQVGFILAAFASFSAAFAGQEMGGTWAYAVAPGSIVFCVSVLWLFFTKPWGMQDD